jgi:hypothetical protein
VIVAAFVIVSALGFFHIPKAEEQLPTFLERLKSVGVDTRLIMQIVVSFVALGAATFVLLSQKFDSKDKNWAYGATGTVPGYWLKK